jgi:uncharacterized Fe-S center protein
MLFDDDSRFSFFTTPPQSVCGGELYNCSSLANSGNTKTIAIDFDSTSRIVLKEGDCTQCGLCVMECPNGVFQDYLSDGNIYGFFCDFCCNCTWICGAIVEVEADCI